MRRTSARLTQLRTHLTRCKWRDKQAEEAYWTLRQAQKGFGKASVNFVAMDSILKQHYNDDMLGRMSSEFGAFYRDLGKQISIQVYGDNTVPRDRLYCMPIDFLSEPRHGESALPGLRRADRDPSDGREAARGVVVGMVESGSSPEQESPGHTVRRGRQASMSHMIDDDPPIKTGASSQAYRDNWDRIFGEKDVTEEFAKEVLDRSIRRDTSAVFPIDAEPCQEQLELLGYNDIAEWRAARDENERDR